MRLHNGIELWQQQRAEAKYKVLKCLGRGVIDLEDIQNPDMLALAKYFLQITRLQKEITELRKGTWKRRKAQLAEVFP